MESVYSVFKFICECPYFTIRLWPSTPLSVQYVCDSPTLIIEAALKDSYSPSTMVQWQPGSGFPLN